MPSYAVVILKLFRFYRYRCFVERNTGSSSTVPVQYRGPGLVRLFSYTHGMTTSSDPTWIDIQLDPRQQRMIGTAIHGNTPFNVPYLSHITGNLYVGGCADGLQLPEDIEHVVSLYPWEQYRVLHDLDSFLTVRMYDSDQGFDGFQVVQIATWVNYCLSRGKTLVHCQAGLNRSNLIAATALAVGGMAPADAVALLREKRSPAVLCNKTFESFVLGL